MEPSVRASYIHTHLPNFDQLTTRPKKYHVNSYLLIDFIFAFIELDDIKSKA